VVPTGTLPNEVAVGLSAVGVDPAAVNGSVKGLLGALVVTVSEVGATAPEVAGVTVNRMEQ
jgi:hypothetical protein